MSQKSVLHFGLNRSGTNFLRELLQRHFNVAFLNKEGERDHPLQKHFRIYDNKKLIARPNFYNEKVYGSFSEFESSLFDKDKPDMYVIISKDPYSWHLSYSRWGKKNNWPASPHPYIYEYNEFYGKWLEFARETDRIVFVRYVDLLKNPTRELRRLKSRFDLEGIRNIRQGIRIKKVPMSRRFSNKKAKYYTREGYLDEFSPGEIKELSSQINETVATQLGYRVI